MTSSLPLTQPTSSRTLDKELFVERKERYTVQPLQWSNLKLPKYRRQRYMVPEHLYQRIMQSTNSVSIEDLRVYHRLLSANNEGELLNRCVWQSLSNGRILDYSGESVKNNSVAINLDNFQQALSAYTARVMTVCAINVNTDLEFEHLMSLTPLDYLFAFLSQGTGILKSGLPRISKHSATFQDLLRIILEEHWNDCADEITKVIQETSETSRSSPHLDWALKFPWGGSDRNMAPKKEPVDHELLLHSLDVELTWMGEPHPLGTLLGFYDWLIYVSEPYSRRPVLEVLRFVNMTAQGSLKGRYVVTTTSQRVLELLKHNINAAVDDKAIDMSSSNLEDVIYGYILALANSALSDAGENFLQSVARAQELDMISRQNPSLSKVQYLLHLEECHVLAAKSYRANAVTVSRFCRPPRIPYRLSPHLDSLRGCSENFSYLAGELDKHARQIAELREGIVEQIELFDKRRNKVVGVLIAIYVPLAFATSFFGMNIEDTSGSDFWINSTATTRSPASGDVGNVTSSEVFSSTDQADSRNWSLWMFYAVAATLTFASIIVPLIAGRAFRSIARFSIRHRSWFRCIVCVIVFALYPALYVTEADSISLLLGCIVGCIAARVNHRRGLRKQSIGWAVWASSCGSMFMINIQVRGEFAIVPAMILLCGFGWGYVLLNWATAPRGQSWLIWRG